MAAFKGPVPAADRVEIRVGGPTGPLLAQRVQIARSFGGKLVGLLGRRALEPGEGLWLDGTNGVHTFMMRFAIDVLFVDVRHRVLAMRPRMAPGRIARAVPGAVACLELAAGESERVGVGVGDMLSVLPE